MDSISDRLQHAMLNKGMSYGELSEVTGIPKSALHRYINGDTEKVPVDRISTIALALGVSTAYLLGWEDADSRDEDPDIRRIERARNSMTPRDRQRMMKMLEAAFDEYFDDTFVDTDKNE